MIFDENRGMRKTQSPKPRPLNSNDVLSDLYIDSKNCRNIEVSYYTPNRRKMNPTTLAFVTAFYEMKGTFHTKFLVFDNNVILTGANISEEYFLDRKDRYILINNCPELADYLQDIVEVYSEAGTKYDNVKSYLTEMTRHEKPLSHLSKYFNIMCREILFI